MYLSKALILNSGPVEKLALTPQFEPNGAPKPILLVGTNGSGKTSILSIVADALIEIAASIFQDAAPAHGVGHKFFRILGGRVTRLNSPFEFSALKFKMSSGDIYYRAKSGTVTPAIVEPYMADFAPVNTWSDDTATKEFVGDHDKIKFEYRRDSYVFFPSMRYEIPHWANLTMLDRDPTADFTPRFDDYLGKPIVVQSSLETLKPWTLDLILDQSVDAITVLASSDLIALKNAAAKTAPYIETLRSLNQIIRIILGDHSAHFVRTNRGRGDARISIAIGDQVRIPALNHLSAGQSSLLSIFATILRYSDLGGIGKRLELIEGIVVIDEVDAHLHADLQYHVLPNLIKLFPRVQFIVGSHAPLFPLGMRDKFGDDGFSIVDLPTGITIDAERFSEFGTSFSYFQATRTFDEAMRAKLTSNQRPLVLCEGQTDPLYLATAADLLGFADVSTSVDFDWVGAPAIEGAKGGGKSHLNDALKFLKNNPQFQIRRTLLLYDVDANKPDEQTGFVFVRSLPRNPENTRRRGGVENLLRDAVFEERFFDEKVIEGDDGGFRKVLNKRRLCDYLCIDKRETADFDNFREPLRKIQELMLPQGE